MNPVKIKTTVYLFSLLLFSCVQIKETQKIIFDEHRLEISGFSEIQRHQLERTIAQLKSLIPGPLEIKEVRYRRLSQFERLFGFPFHGGPLSAWVLRRFSNITYGNPWTVAVNQNKGTLIIGDLFFTELSDLERLYLLVHEARHSDKHGFKHSLCPEGFPFVSAGQPKQDLQEALACDKTPNGAYAYQAAFLFEIFAYGLFEQREAGLLYNSSISRIIQ
ncbi:MAG: hypothetical protein VST69_04435 [Nitrospirota bacterium]|nr:hypothetical protein [Nitrospirota bacterium]